MASCVDFNKFYQDHIYILTIYKTSIRSQLDYADVICDQAHNSSFYEKLKSL